MYLKIRLIGECNFCGLCCVKDGFQCINLVVTGRIGEPEATKCAVYSTRYDGMPILRVDKSGHVKSGAKCSYESEMEDLEILASGVGKGCSLIPTIAVS